MARESPHYVASEWALFSSSILLCIFIATRALYFRTWGGWNTIKSESTQNYARLSSSAPAESAREDCLHSTIPPCFFQGLPDPVAKVSITIAILMFCD